MVNTRLGTLQEKHHISNCQIQQLQEAFGEVDLLLDLASMDDNPLNKVLKSGSNLDAVQFFGIRQVLGSLGRQSKAG